ncbi:19540_t:CDS:2 [Entrophospora sp. SA101]|nr:12596_t:CDS:2 [Entrophospora sp. SA101]CAJ0752782.1 19540_t:CDS:2 [Entrophospora sp. SA101]CAJ0843710.1 3295_t:CDS:2 [Entrophospora sp. SA101]CAJ0885534.1 10919_t:CDS:2 [Entrophospora sp. SA101]
MENKSTINIEAISQELAKNLEINENNVETIDEIKKNIEDMSVSMDDTKNSLKQVRNDIDTRSEIASKELYEAAHHLDSLYNKIDSLERFISVVKQTVNDVTDRVDEAENFLTNPINRVLDKLKMTTAKSVEPSQFNLPPMKPLKIYKTLDHFPESNTTNELEEDNNEKK